MKRSKLLKYRMRRLKPKKEEQTKVLRAKRNPKRMPHQHHLLVSNSVKAVVPFSISSPRVAYLEIRTSKPSMQL